MSTHKEGGDRAQGEERACKHVTKYVHGYIVHTQTKRKPTNFVKTGCEGSIITYLRN